MPIAKLKPRSARRHLQDFAFGDLFVDDLGWNLPESSKPLTVEHEGQTWKAREVSQLSGFRVLEVTPTSSDTPFPDKKTQNALWKKIAPHAVENILIFIDPERTRSVWLWMKREGKKTVPRHHYYLKGQPGDLFLSKLSALVVDISELDEEGDVHITDAVKRVQDGLDIQTVTKLFFRDFQDEHHKLLDAIQGIPDPKEKRWYASVILNRLMFIWFLQKKGFLDVGKKSDGEHDYLSDQLTASKKSGKNQFFSHFLRDLFFEGFAKPESNRKPIGSLPLGDIPYLNGGLFIPHGIEYRIEGDSLMTAAYQKISIPDTFFDDLFTLFSAFTWSLNDTPGGDDREINPDVLGYIFEQYINQKEFGAYYTCAEITDYLCEQTIHQLVLEQTNAGYNSAKKLHETDPHAFSKPRRYADMQDLLLHSDGPACRKIIQDILPKLSLLDPACGSGAFLVAAQKTLLNLYTALIGRCEALSYRPVLQWIEHEKSQHRAPIAYWLKKKIVTENLFGVDLMEEATEIAKLRLFLSLVASAEKRDQLEPLPNIEFNLLPGNSLIGLLHVDPSDFDSKKGIPKKTATQIKRDRENVAYEQAMGLKVETSMTPKEREKIQAHVAKKQAVKYEELLKKKNDCIRRYKKSTSLFKDLAECKREIEALKKEARLILDQLLLDQFQALGIQYNQATWDLENQKAGKIEKRALRIGDIAAFTPFHWAYEFDEIIVNRGGFDAIITNPPWDVFQTSEKEFSSEYEATITKNAIRIEDWKKQFASLMEKEDFRHSWLNYASSFPAQWAFFKQSKEYQNQISSIKGKAVGNKPNLYNLFVERCFRLSNKKAYTGLIIPSGFYTDLGSKQLRSLIFNETRVTGLFGFENRKKIFNNVDSRFKFIVLTFKKGSKTKSFPASFMRHDVTELNTFPNKDSLIYPTEIISELSPDSHSIIEFKNQKDINLSHKMAKWPFLNNDDKGWQLELYGEELNMTRSAKFFKTTQTPMPLYEGGMIWQFDHSYSAPRYWIDEKEIKDIFLIKKSKRIIPKLKEIPVDLVNDYTQMRIGIRKIASNTNERTLIAALIPPNSPAGNSLSVHFPYHHTKEAYSSLRYSLSELLFILSVFNSFVTDYTLRSRMTTNLNLFFLYQLPIPRLTPEHPDFLPLVERAARLIGTAPEFDDLIKEVFGKKATHKTHGVTDLQDRLTIRAEIDALVARLYDLSVKEFQHILTTFPLVDEATKSQTLNAYRNLVDLGSFPRNTLT